MGDVKETEYMSVAVEDPGKKTPNSTNSRKSSLRQHGVKCVTRRTTLETILLCVLFIVVVLVLMLIIGLIIQSKKGSNVCLSKECVAAAGALLECMDTEADPCEDFYQYACGGWEKRTTIPEEKDQVNVLGQLQDRLQVLCRGLLEEDSPSNRTDAETKVKLLYEACVDEESIEDHDVAPLLTYLDSLGGWPAINEEFDDDSWNLEEVLTRIRLQGDTNFLFAQTFRTDIKNSSSYLFFIDQPYLGMKSRDHFLRDKSDSVVKAYLTYMVSIVTELRPHVNKTMAIEEMDAAYELERQIANATLRKDQRRDLLGLYQKLSIGELTDIAPQFDWIRYFRLVFDDEGIDATDEVYTFNLQYMTSMANIIGKTPKRVIANFLMWRVTMSSVDQLCSRLKKHRLEYQRVVAGEKASEPQWTTCVRRCNLFMGNALGAMFIREHFDERSKIEAQVMVNNIRSVLFDVLRNNEWMDEQTRKQAIEKVETTSEMIGYDESLMNSEMVNTEFESVNITDRYHFKNILALLSNKAMNMRIERREAMNGKETIDNPVVANAFYMNTHNRIYLPAGIFQEPFYSRLFPKAMNYGGIGMVIGHELTHGFDDKGRTFDKDGTLREWFTPDSVKAFNEKKQCFINQYSNFSETQNGEKISLNGVLTQGENIADNGGLKEAYLAYRQLVDKTGGEEPELPGLGLSNDQLFFLNFGQIWCSRYRPQSLRDRLISGSHPPQHFRVRGSIMNSYQFAEAYKCPVGSPMNPKHKCEIW